jgi:hypothetical protein
VKKEVSWLRAHWGNLFMATWLVEPAQLAKCLPPGCEPDLWNGKIPLSLVGVEFSQVAVKGTSWPWHDQFPEINLRTYVQGSRGPGVAFLGELVPKYWVAWMARRSFGEPYQKAKVWIEKRVRLGEPEVTYHWESNERSNRISVKAGACLTDIPSGGLDSFLLTRDRGYNARKGGTTYTVTHEPWKIREVRRFAVDCPTGSPFGSVYAPIFRTEPDSVLFSEGSSVDVGFPKRSND